MILLYNALLRFAGFLAQALALVLPGVREFFVARNGALGRWREAMKQISPADRIWFHVSSVGELEQVRPVIERMGDRGIHNIVLSYFSPSVARAVKDFSFVAYADFLPLDFPDDMRELMEIVKPRVLVLNRYDLWPNHLRAANELNVPVVLVNASTPPFGFFGTLGLWLRYSLFQSISYWTYVDSEAADAWEPYIRGGVKGLVAGNPRVDRAIRRVDEAKKQSKIQAQIARWQHEKIFTVIAGSTWWEDESVLLDAWGILRKKNAKLRLVIVPHEPTSDHLEKLIKELKRRRYSFALFSEKKDSNAEVLIVDGRGFLAEIYGEGAVAYVGGGFTREIHSIIEPLAHELPVAFGPKCRRSPEAEALLALGSAFRIQSASSAAAEQLAQWFLMMLDDGSEARRARESLRIFLSIHRGAGERVGDFLAECLKSSVMLKATEVQHGK